MLVRAEAGPGTALKKEPDVEVRGRALRWASGLP